MLKTKTMNKKELRIGNIVGREYWNPAPTGKTKEYETCTIVTLELENLLTTESLKRNKYFKTTYDNIKPIPLTTEWLEKFGFNIDNENNEANKDFERYSILIDTEQMGVHVYNESYYENLFLMYARTDYVHEFQNLIFALTNEELTIKS